MAPTTAVQQTKRWYQSKTVWGAILSAAATAIALVGPAVGIHIPVEWIAAVAGAFGITVTIYGRSKAAGPLDSAGK